MVTGGVSGLPYYRTPMVCVLDVIRGLAVWRHHNQKQKTVAVCVIGGLAVWRYDKPKPNPKPVHRARRPT